MRLEFNRVELGTRANFATTATNNLGSRGSADSYKLKHFSPHPDADVEAWAMDEHRVGLKPVLRRVWVPQGEQPIANVNWRFEWLWLYGFVHPNSGQTYWWILPYVRIDLFNRVLADFAQHFGVGKHKRIVLAIDQAGWHKA